MYGNFSISPRKIHFYKFARYLSRGGWKYWKIEKYVNIRSWILDVNLLLSLHGKDEIEFHKFAKQSMSTKEENKK